MAAPFDTSNVSIYGQYSQYENAGSSAPTGSSRALAFLFASSSTGQAADTKLYLVNGTGSAGIVATTGEFNFAVAGDSGAAQNITDGNQLTLLLLILLHLQLILLHSTLTLTVKPPRLLLLTQMRCSFTMHRQLLTAK